ncbi:MAG: hypothetical protein J1F32_01805 [Erysipelotrichales bacterium]|nr:hypothetical protein [Erysipelotrichales bacterium]
MKSRTKVILTAIAFFGLGIGLVGGLSHLKNDDKVSNNSSTNDVSSNLSINDKEKEIDDITIKYYLQQSSSEDVTGINYELELNPYEDTKWVYFNDYTINYGCAYRIKIEKTITYTDKTKNIENTFSNETFEWGNTGNGAFFYWTGLDEEHDINEIGEVLQDLKNDLYFIETLEIWITMETATGNITKGSGICSGVDSVDVTDGFGITPNKYGIKVIYEKNQAYISYFSNSDVRLYPFNQDGTILRFETCTLVKSIKVTFTSTDSISNLGLFVGNGDGVFNSYIESENAYSVNETNFFLQNKVDEQTGHQYKITKIELLVVDNNA